MGVIHKPHIKCEIRCSGYIEDSLNIIHHTSRLMNYATNLSIEPMPLFTFDLTSFDMAFIVLEVRN